MTDASGSRFSAGIWIFNQIIDRYATDGYAPPVSTLEAIEMAGRTGVLSEVDLNYPFTDPAITVDDVRKALEDANLGVTNITPSIYSRVFRNGSFSSADPKVRRQAADLAQMAVEVAGTLGARYVKYWPGQDGFDYPFQVDYRRLRDHAIGGIGKIARAHPDVRFAIEYKLKEPRTHLFWSTAAETLLAIGDMDVPNVGVVVDFGHSMFAKENPSQALHLINGHDRLVDVELDDNLREWDDDLSVGAVHLVETLEFLQTVREIGWTEPIKLDLFPYREDPIRAVQASIETIQRLQACCDRLDVEALNEARATHDALAAQRIALDALLGSA
jgi:xylose isomerase